MYLTFAVGTGSDISVALALCWFLSRARTGMKKCVCLQITSHRLTKPLLQDRLHGLDTYDVHREHGSPRRVSIAVLSHTIFIKPTSRICAALGMITYTVMPENFIFLGKSSKEYMITPSLTLWARFLPAPQ